MARFLWATLLVVVSVLVATEARSDEFGHNPQHDFGSVVGKKLNPVIPFWTMLGDAFANEDFVRLTPDRQSKMGGVWNSQPMTWESWEVLLQFNVNGVGKVGADGFAWWLVKEVNVMGRFFGFREEFHGIGVVVDTYDNDGNGQHPSISLCTNDGTKTYSHAGVYHDNDMELGRCSYPVRNTKENTIMKITFDSNTVKVELKGETGDKWTECIFAENVFVESGLHMGLTAATGHLADNHDVHGITVRNLDQDAKFMDSETKFAQFSKYTVAESLSRIQSDIRGALYETAVTGAKPRSDDSPTSAHYNDVARQLSDLKRDLQAVATGIQQAQPSTHHAGAPVQSGISEGKLEQMLSPVESNTREVRAVSNNLRKGAGDLQGETKKLSKIHNKLEDLIMKVEEGERNEIESKGFHQLSKEKYQQKQQREEENSDGLFSVWNLLFVVLCVVCFYLAFTLYRIKSPKGGLRP